MDNAICKCIAVPINGVARVDYICRACGLVCSLLTRPLYLAVPVSLSHFLSALFAASSYAESHIFDDFSRKSSDLPN